MNADRFRPVLCVQYFLLIVDILCNSFADHLRWSNVVQLVIFVVQDVCILFNIIVIFLMFFNTYVFQAGLIGVLMQQFRLTIVTAFSYLALSIGFHVWLLTKRWDNPFTFVWTGGFHALFVIHRLLAVFYYYFYKRTALKISDPKFYHDSEWIRSHLNYR
ncbi:TMEM138 (predicted) [Pycnogonum litorale]